MLHRAIQTLNEFSRNYPNAWKQIDSFREGRGKDLPMWEDWCYAPLAAWYSIVSHAFGKNRLTEPGEVLAVSGLAAVGSWRVTQGIYRFDPALYDAIIKTEITGDLPVEILFRLPEWCVYIEAPGLQYDGGEVYGFFAHLEHDQNTHHAELRLLIDTANGHATLPLHLDTSTLDAAIDKMIQTSLKNVGLAQLPDGFSLTTKDIPTLRNEVEPFISLLLYLCSQNAEIGDGQRLPTFPEPRKTKSGLRMFAPDKPTMWDVGLRIGAALRRAYHNEQTHQGGSHSSPRPHIRRAHWHSFWSGSRKESDNRKKQLKWLPPIAINVDLGEIVPTVHPLRD